jgi:hypothetical protein
MFGLHKAQKGVNTMFRKGQNTALKLSKGLAKASDVIHKGAVVVQKVGEATGISQLEGAGKAVAMGSNKLGNALDKGSNKLERIVDKSERIQDKVNKKFDKAQDKIDDGLQRAKNVKQILKTDGQEVVNDGKKVFGV